MPKLIKPYDQLIFLKFHHYGKRTLQLRNAKKKKKKWHILILRVLVLHLYASSYFILNCGLNHCHFANSPPEMGRKN